MVYSRCGIVTSTVDAPKLSNFSIDFFTELSTSVSIPSPKNSFGIPITFFSMGFLIYSVYLSTLTSTEVESSGSLPDIISSINAESYTHLVMGPI